MSFDPLFVYGNYAEACLWTGMGGLAFAKRNSRWSLLLASALIAFGASDVAKTHTGAWYRPWWMLAWKAICVGLIVWSGLLVLAIARTAKANGSGPSQMPDSER